ncbi:MAG: glycosyltransferase family 2 protein, partial [Litorivicinus sp.]
MSDKLPISAIVITKNEAHNIERCLTSVSFCAQIVVLDSGSTDGTRAIAEAMGAEVSLSDDWPGFGPQKNRALALANQPWVLSIDADEWVEPDLAGAIARHLTSEQPAAILRASS